MSEHTLVFNQLLEQYANEHKRELQDEEGSQSLRAKRFVLTQSIFEYQIDLSNEQTEKMWSVLTPEQLAKLKIHKDNWF